MVQQQVLGPTRDEAGAELAEHAEVKAGVGELEPEGIFPVDAGAHSLGGLPITEVLQELEHRHKRQSPRGQAGLAPSHGNESGLTGRQPEELSKILGIPSGAFAAPLEAPLIAGLPHEVESEVAHDRHVLGAMFWAPCPLRRREWSSPKSTSSTQCRLVSMRQCARTA